MVYLGGKWQITVLSFLVNISSLKILYSQFCFFEIHWFIILDVFSQQIQIHLLTMWLPRNCNWKLMKMLDYKERYWQSIVCTYHYSGYSEVRTVYCELWTALNKIHLPSGLVFPSHLNLSNWTVRNGEVSSIRTASINWDLTLIYNFISSLNQTRSIDHLYWTCKKN
jgi:hypothetical protein